MKFEGCGIKWQRIKVLYMRRNLIMFKAEKIFNEKNENPEPQKQAKAFVKNLCNNIVFSLEAEIQHS